MRQINAELARGRRGDVGEQLLLGVHQEADRVPVRGGAQHPAVPAVPGRALGRLQGDRDRPGAERAQQVALPDHVEPDQPGHVVGARPGRDVLRRPGLRDQALVSADNRIESAKAKLNELRQIAAPKADYDAQAQKVTCRPCSSAG